MLRSHKHLNRSVPKGASSVLGHRRVCSLMLLNGREDCVVTGRRGQGQEEEWKQEVSQRLTLG